MIYPFLKLETVMLLTGIVVVLAHAFALWKPVTAQEWLRAFPRSKVAGFLLLSLAALWSWALIATIDLGEFSNWRTRLLIIVPVAYILTLKFVDEFLAARALGMLVLLAAEPLLEAAFLRHELGRLVLVALVYVWILCALFWIGMPYVLRDQIAWVSATPRRWVFSGALGAACGLALLISPLTLHR